MASAEEQDAQFTAGDVERRLADLERRLAMYEGAGLDRLGQSGYLQFDGIPMRWDTHGMQIASGGADVEAIWFVNELVPDPSTEFPSGTLRGVVGTGYATTALRADGVTNEAAQIFLSATDAFGSEVDLYVLTPTRSYTVRLLAFDANDKAILELGDKVVLEFDSVTSDAAGLNDGTMWYRSDTDKFRGKANGANDNFAMEGWVSTEIATEIAGVGNMPMPPIVGTQSWNCLGTELGIVGGSAASATWPANNRVIGIPVKVTEDCTVTKLWIYNGATANANINMCLYDESFAQVANSEMGSTAQAGTDVIQEFDITNVALTAGLYYIACVFSATTGTAYRYSSTVVEELQGWGMWQQGLANVDLPSTATPAVVASAYLPLMGMSVSPRTLVT